MSNTNDHSWSDMPIEILTSVAECLATFPINTDLFHFGSVCQTWRQASFNVGVRSSMPSLINTEYMLLSDGKTTTSKCELSDFWHKQIYDSFAKVFAKTLTIDVFVHASKNGWLLLSDEHYDPCFVSISFLFYNPFRNMIIGLPPKLTLQLDQEIAVSRFTTNPTCSSDCHIFVACGCSSKPRRICRIFTCNLKDDKWTSQDIHGDKELWDVAYMDGAFYCVFSEGFSIVMDTFTFRSDDAIEQADDEQCGPFITSSSSSSSSLKRKENDKFFLVEADGDLLLAIYSLDDTSNYCHVYQFDPSQKEWTRIKSLGNRVLILSSNVDIESIVVPAVRDAKEFANMIFVLRDSKHESYICESTEGTWRFDKMHDLISPEGFTVRIEPPDLWH